MFAGGEGRGEDNPVFSSLLKKEIRKVQCMYMEVLIAALFVLGVANLRLQQWVLPISHPPYKFIATTFPS